MPLFGVSRTWYLYNLDTKEKLQGQFVAENVVENVGGTYAERWALSRQHSILQFVHGNSDTVTFQGRFFMTSELLVVINDPKVKIQTLKKWVRRDQKLGRPPILSFWIGDAHLSLTECILEQVSNITYAPPSASGLLRDVSFTINLRQWWPYDISLGTEPPETRYHPAKRRDYYEMLALREYANPMLGDVIRKRHPDKTIVRVGDLIKLPSKAAIETARITQTSEPLRTAFGPSLTAQKVRRLEMLETRGGARTSHVLLGH